MKIYTQKMGEPLIDKKSDDYIPKHHSNIKGDVSDGEIDGGNLTDDSSDKE